MTPAILWFLAGFVLILSEFALPGVILVFIGLGAWVTALAAQMGWVETLSGQVILFAVSSTALLLGLRSVFQGWFLGHSTAAAPAGTLDEFTGQKVRVLHAISAGQTGKVEFKGTPWNAASEDSLQPGETAIIVSLEGLCLKVSRV